MILGCANFAKDNSGTHCTPSQWGSPETSPRISTRLLAKNVLRSGQTILVCAWAASDSNSRSFVSWISEGRDRELVNHSVFDRAGRADAGSGRYQDRHRCSVRPDCVSSAVSSIRAGGVRCAKHGPRGALIKLSAARSLLRAAHSGGGDTAPSVTRARVHTAVRLMSWSSRSRVTGTAYSPRRSRRCLGR